MKKPTKSNFSAMEREKMIAKSNFLRNMYYIDHKYKNCPCYKCICGKCFCPMKKHDLPSKDGNSISSYRDFYRPWELQKQKCYKPSNLYEKNSLPFYPNSDYNENYKDWSKIHDPNPSTNKKQVFDQLFALRTKDPSDTEHRSAYKPYDISDFPGKVSKKHETPTKLPFSSDYRTDYSTNYVDFKESLVCPARVELDKLAKLERESKGFH